VPAKRGAEIGRRKRALVPLPSPLSLGIFPLVAGGPSERFTKLKRCNIPFLAWNGQGSMPITSPVAVDQRPKKPVTALIFHFRFGVNAGCFTSSISPTLSKRSAICAILVFRVGWCHGAAHCALPKRSHRSCKGNNRAVKRWMLGTLQGSTVHKYPMIISTNSSSASTGEICLTRKVDLPSSPSKPSPRPLGCLRNL
jgi:hypothetical protein